MNTACVLIFHGSNVHGPAIANPTSLLPRFPALAVAPIARSVTFNMACKRGIIGKDLVIYNVTEPSTCQYVINAASPLACGCESQCFVAGRETRNCGSGA
jgi:hypothetical protein